ncbi:MAG: hypothetical protein M3345_01970 [Actinomycetota bacterium]|nr:hypothetical protein [Actinomycetota bacterium]
MDRASLQETLDLMSDPLAAAIGCMETAVQRWDRLTESERIDLVARGARAAQGAGAALGTMQAHFLVGRRGQAAA